MEFRLSQRSLNNLIGVHADLVRVVKRAITITTVDFGVLEGVRSQERQRELFRAGATKTTNSRHLTGHAVDLVAYVNGEIRWDWPLYGEIAKAMKTAAALEGVSITWGGDWKFYPDGGHFQLTWGEYPR